MEEEVPKFRLNEPALATLNSQMSSDVDSNGDNASFVVLGKNSWDFTNNVSLMSFQQIQEKSVTESNSIITSSHEEIESKVTELLRENAKLKKALIQNNKAMESQFHRLITYQEELMEIYENHKQKFVETRNTIRLLQKENAELKLKLPRTDSIVEYTSLREMVAKLENQRKDSMYDHALCFTPTISSNSNVQKCSSTDSREEKKMNDSSNEEINRMTKLNEKHDRDILSNREIVSSFRSQLQTLMENSIEEPIENIINPQSSESHQQFLDNEQFSIAGECNATQTSCSIDIADDIKRKIERARHKILNQSLEPIYRLSQQLQEIIFGRAEEQLEAETSFTSENMMDNVDTINVIFYELNLLQKSYEDLLEKFTKLKTESERKNMEAETHICKKNEETISILKLQLNIFENDFKEEEIAKQAVLKQQEQLSEQMNKLKMHNQKLLGQIFGSPFASLRDEELVENEEYCRLCEMYIMPEQWHGLDLCQPRE